MSDDPREHADEPPEALDPHIADVPDRPHDPAWGFVSPGETRWPAVISMVVVVVCQLLLPERITLGPTWLIPAIEAAILLTLLIVGPSTLDSESKDVRHIALTLIGVLIAANVIILWFVLHTLLKTGQMVNGRALIYSAATVWSTGVISFGLLYWELDRGGPIARCSPNHPAPDFLFPQMGSAGSTDGPWTPRFLDYLYVSLTNSVAFSPTDALPLTRRAKIVMATQSLASLATIVVVGARAVNILN
ncbi:MAG: hypothetical protein JWL72_1880 [Ilumatobacteraceae bacterium]|nr:hypothetical protein [Ilumatobacteraceae bacterium]